MARRRIVRRLVVTVALLTTSAVALEGGAGAQAEEPTWTLSPATVSDGSSLSASGTGCLDPETGTGEGMRAVVVIPKLSYPNSDNPDGTAYFLSDPVLADGSWTMSGGVDLREEFFGPYDDFTTTATAGCLRGGSEPIFTYEQTYDVTYRGNRPSTTTLAEASTTTVPAPVAPPAAPPAAPVAASPAFTG